MLTITYLPAIKDACTKAKTAIAIGPSSRYDKSVLMSARGHTGNGDREERVPNKNERGMEWREVVRMLRRGRVSGLERKSKGRLGGGKEKVLVDDLSIQLL